MKNLILSVGGTPDPLVKSIDIIKPDKVIFIASKKTKSQIDEIKEFTSDQKYQHEIITLENSEDLHEVFLAGYKAKAYCNQGEIYVDYTGGTKSMSVGLALSCFGKDIKKYLYIGGDKREKEGVGTVKPGHEKLIQKIDPASLYAFNIAKKVEQLFNIGQYKLVYDLLDHEISDTSHNENSNELVGIKNLASALQLWDSMNYHQSYAELKKYQKETKSYHSLLFQVNIPQNFEEHLEKCKGENKDYRVRDLIYAARRKKEYGEYDEAVLRIYRAIEYIGQVAFQQKFNCETSNVQFENLKQFIDHNIYIYKRIEGKYRKYDRVKLSFSDTYEALNKAQVKEGQAYTKHINDFEKFNNMRHQSVLAHGFESCQEKHAEDGLKLIKLLKNISKVDDPFHPISILVLSKNCK